MIRPRVVVLEINISLKNTAKTLLEVKDLRKRSRAAEKGSIGAAEPKSCRLSVD